MLNLIRMKRTKKNLGWNNNIFLYFKGTYLACDGSGSKTGTLYGPLKLTRSDFLSTELGVSA